MGNTVSAHICRFKVFRPDWTPLSIGGKKLVSLGTTEFGILGGKASTHV